MRFGAFDQFYEATWSGLRGFLRTRGVPPDHLDDILQESYLRFLANPPRGNHFNQKKAYLYQIAMRIRLDEVRNAIRSVQDKGYEAIQELEPRVEAQLDWKYLLQYLSEKECNLLWLAYAEEFSHQEIGEIMGLQRGSIKVMLYRIKSKLKQYFE
ncbi:MAG: sigma-70 family RNA polymerase sigma factor [Saprospiraceae bacterium]|nr:sigma-70 family RNA polymerase sigma factor [Saprospiraceae bacterium]MCB9319318.1 sigma-70 family RNA polymerase sigma factor [Lewinellaceae bacterium]